MPRPIVCCEHLTDSPVGTLGALRIGIRSATSSRTPSIASYLYVHKHDLQLLAVIFALVTLAATNPQNIPTSITALPSVSVPAVQMDICVSTTQHHERPRILSMSQRPVAVRRLPMMLLQDPDNYASESEVMSSYDARCSDPLDI